ncbi:MAG: cytochrome c-type biogenesis protein [Pseudomonadota bacterium]
MRSLLFAVLLALLAPSAGAGAPAGTAPALPAAPDPVLEKRVMTLSEQLRCLVCQNQTIADSHADLAIDLKNQVREKLAKGMADQDVIDYMVQRYGDFVLYKPPVKRITWLLWFGPFALLAGGIALLMVNLRRRRPQEEVAMPPEQLARAAELLRAGTQMKETP